jgi:cytochrome P450
MTQEAPFIDVDFASAVFKRDPFPTYKELQLNTPVGRFRASGPAGGNAVSYAISRYADVSALIKDDRFVKDTANAGLPPMRVPGFMRPLMRNMLAMDDPDHARLKKLVMAAFTPKRVEMMRERTKAISSQLLDKLARRTHFDIIADYALPLPVTVISDLLGVPAPDQVKFAKWSGALIRAGRSNMSALLSLPGILRFLRYLKYLIALKRAEPQDDLVSALVAAEAEGDKLNSEELMAMIAILLSAGHETTVNLIGNGMHTLLTHPDAMAQLRSQPEIIGSAVEELLRFSGPVATLTHRYAKEDAEIAGTLIPKGSLVFGLVAAANRDEKQFENADQVVLTRSANRHLSFGEGGHYCVGASLARMEGAIAINDLLQRMPNLSLAQPPETLTWTSGLVVLRGLDHLPVKTNVL